MVAFSEEMSKSQKDIVENIKNEIGHYQVYNDGNLVNKFNQKIQKLLGSCKDTLRETFSLEDYEEEGVVSIGAIKEAFTTLDIQIEQDLLDYIIYVIYQKSESSSKMKYGSLIDLIEGKLVQGQLSNSSDNQQTRKRPESSSPEKLKARNKDKFN